MIFKQGDGHLVAACDGCGFGWWTNDEKVPTFTGSRRNAIKSLIEDHGWRIKRRILRRLPLMLCATCAPPAGHPESMTAVLSDADEGWLVALVGELDPDHANEEA